MWRTHRHSVLVTVNLQFLVYCNPLLLRLLLIWFGFRIIFRFDSVLVFFLFCFGKNMIQRYGNVRWHTHRFCEFKWNEHTIHNHNRETKEKEKMKNKKKKDSINIIGVCFYIDFLFKLFSMFHWSVDSVMWAI